MDVPATTDGRARRPAGLGARGAALPPRRGRDQGLDRGEGGRARHRRPRQGPALRADAAALVYASLKSLMKQQRHKLK